VPRLSFLTKLETHLNQSSRQSPVRWHKEGQIFVITNLEEAAKILIDGRTLSKVDALRDHLKRANCADMGKGPTQGSLLFSFQPATPRSPRKLQTPPVSRTSASSDCEKESTHTQALLQHEEKKWAVEKIQLEKTNKILQQQNVLLSDTLREHKIVTKQALDTTKEAMASLKAARGLTENALNLAMNSTKKQQSTQALAETFASIAKDIMKNLQLARATLHEKDRLIKHLLSFIDWPEDGSSKKRSLESHENLQEKRRALGSIEPTPPWPPEKMDEWLAFMSPS
jgi:hypothetical protein